MKTPTLGFLPLLTLVFITLRLCDVIDWSWWWVLAPMWALPAFALTLAAMIFAFSMLVSLAPGPKRKGR